jgi:hypothetical protein
MMSKIQVLKHGTDLQLGKGGGNVDRHAKTASIIKWDEKPALQIGGMYKLKSNGKIYPNANCTNNGLPATFDNVE